MPEPRDAQGFPIFPRVQDARRDHANAFVAYKGRVPANRAEFIEWLIEYSNFQEDILQRTMEAYEKHMRVCTRPLIITKAGFLSK
jgi:hypothetical protein